MAEEFNTRTPGQMLRAARERQEHSLHDAHEGTKIPVHLLEAIERDEYHKLSGPIYVKSFLRNYSGWLGLDPEEILSVYELATGRPEPTPSADAEVWSEDQVAVTRVGMPWGRLVALAVGAVVLLVVIVLLVMRLFGGDSEPAPGPAARSGAAVPEQRTVVTQADTEPAANPPEPASSPLADGGDAEPDQEQQPTPSVEDADSDRASPEDAASEAASTTGAGDGVVAKVQPGQRDETREERLARLDRYRLGGLPAEQAAPDPSGGASAGAVDPEPATPEPPAPRRGDPDLRFLGGESFPLVLRVLMPEAANCTVRRDDQADAVPVIWPEDPSPPPAYNLRHGVAYAVRDGYAIYWGAEDHFTLTLGRIAGAEVTLNGHPQPLGDWRPGQTKLLDRSSLPGGG